MKIAITPKLIMATATTLYSISAVAQNNEADTLKLYNVNEIVVTATRIPQEIKAIPQRIQVLPSFRLTANPQPSAGDALNQISGINYNREFGFLSKKSLVSLRGMGNEQGRTLILIDGVPANKASTGSVDLNQINPDNIERIEVVKGPLSSLYGGNSMGGTINIVTKRPVSKLDGSARISWGEMGTFGTSGMIGTNLGRIYGTLSGMYRKSDGYNTTPKADRNEGSIASFLNEFGINKLVGFNITEHQSIEATGVFYKGTRGNGERYYFNAPQKGQLDMASTYKDQNYRLHYKGTNGNTGWNVAAFYAQEDYSENKSKGKDLFDVDAKRRDWGLWGNMHTAIGSQNILSAGAEYKGGYVNGRDLYRTATDKVINKGTSMQFGIWVQDEFTLLDSKLKLVPSLRYDVARVYNGGYFIEDGTKVTEVFEQFTGKLPNATWHAFSPKLSVQYTFNNDYRIFANVARGFRPGTLEDMTRTGAINGGVVIANPDLKPEHVWSYELGADLTPCRFVTISPSIYYTRGTDFIYNVNTGETIQMGNKERPLFRKTNLAKADIFGAEADLYFNLSEHFNLFTGFSYTHAKIKEGTASIFGKETDLAGHYMTYVPKTKVSAGFTWWNRYVNINTAYVQYSKQYIDDLNEEQLSAMGTVDLKLWHTFASKLTVSFNARNLFDRQVVDKGNLSMGRYLYGEVSLRF